MLQLFDEKYSKKMFLLILWNKKQYVLKNKKNGFISCWL